MSTSSSHAEFRLHDDKGLEERVQINSPVLRIRSISKKSTSAEAHHDIGCTCVVESAMVKEDSECVAGGVDNIGFNDITENRESIHVHGVSSGDSNDIIGNTTFVEGAVPSSMSSTASEGDPNNRLSSSFARYKGSTYALISTILLSFCSISVALLSGSVGSNEIVFTQMFLELLFCIPVSTLQKVSFRMTKKAFLLVLYRAIIGSIINTMVYFAFQIMPVANAKAIIYTSPVFTALLSCLILQEACSVFDIIFSILALSGVLLVIQPTFIFGGDESTSSFLGPTLCLISAFLIGTIFIALRRLGSYKVHPICLLIVLSIVGMVISSIVTTVLHEWVIPRCGIDRLLLIINASFMFLSQVGLTLALRYERATTVSLIRTSDVFFTFILDYIFFGIVPNYITIIGAFLVIGSLIGLTLRKWWSEKKQQAKSSHTGDQEYQSDVGSLEMAEND